MKYTPTIGLEIHAELKTRTKMFCNSKNDTEEKRPNVNICPVCMGHPGTLPVINKEAVKHVVSIGLAVGGTIADFTEFDRKNYFYPDIPKGYQISQFAYPLVRGGSISGVELTRIHLEEDTAKSSHDKGDYSLVDFNRAGVPLMELVTEPVIHDAKTAGDFARELQLLLQYLGIGDANMEKGEMRVEANISISDDLNKLGTKVEVKNLNSFKSVEKAIEYEIKRHAEILDAGGTITQETRGWDEGKQETFSQRAKEESHDYRYFPDPDLPKLKLSLLDEFDLEKGKSALPELPWHKRERMVGDYGIKTEHAEFYVRNRGWGAYFETVASQVSDKEYVQLASNYIVSDITGLVSDEHISEESVGKLTPDALVAVVQMIASGELSSRGAKDTIAILFKEGGDAKEVAEKNNLIQKNDPEFLKKIVHEVIKENQTVVDEYKSGKEQSLQFLVGQVMKKSQGSANPGLAKESLLAAIQ
ncbi:MAG: Asp-tRNA(Asn)/Glu-tRNA(Gln) amidotransferase GatCAB subunit B [Candidatus Zambryskibacteria bacterium CG10_big_fil_rev_8_21_14_0_10_42_12]|uniref:Aspartyl/glutamyl-tRNA(Asn/Gln) amidotransferase subunit B n=1 Tax=Candidatus Zambryskibacteria bacterium CG10_big_fil_rev_8_21_14_0_10_42_12 TaxID=1975115 RepID=A0A2H0QVC9_9BACT|nr:MAG: Asp-tRNA(Asn)/Glu-tRNA(Gln) amidotransferase GatCAB subunit B [Candidatus Zambryskibacteria bacterium CG10_big_fil_rev_8_21_14_0_10_42_12]